MDATKETTPSASPEQAGFSGAPGSALAILTDLVEDPHDTGDYRLNISGMSLAMLWEAIEKQEQELQGYRKGGLTEEVLRRHDGRIKVGHGCAIVTAAFVDNAEWMETMLRSAHAATDLDTARARALKGLNGPNAQAES